jgi:hypothetical protein
VPSFTINWTPSDTSSFRVPGGSTGVRVWQTFQPSLTVNGVPTDVNNLPLGFNILTASLSLHFIPVFNGSATSPSPTSQSEIISGLVRYSSSYVQNDLTLLNGIPIGSLTYSNPIIAGVMFDIFQITDRIDNTSSSPATSVGWDTPATNALVTAGTYSIISTKWVISNLTNPGKEFVPGDTGKITSSDGSYNFSTVTKVTINSTDITVFTVQTAAEVQFVVPSNTPSESNQPTTVTDPTNFTGSALAGYVTVVTADASGVYTLTPGATHDTVYISSQVDGTTNNVAIPNPFASTGFING